jgi:nucleotide-binding universal stress UspA family protein
MYKRILVPLDGSALAEQVLPYARLLAKGLSSHIELLRIYEPVPESLAVYSRGKTARQLSAMAHSEVRAYLDGIATGLRKEGLAVTCTVQEGDAPALAIVSQATQEADTLVAMSTHGRSGVTRWIMGSVTEKVLLATTTPLLVVRSLEQKEAPAGIPLESIIVPLDGSALAEQVLPHVVHLAKALSLKVLLARVTPSPADYYRYAEFPVGWYEDLSKEVDASALEELEDAAKRLRQLSVATVETKLLHGSAAGAVVDLAKQTPRSLVAMTTHGRSGVGRWLLGSVADRVVSHSNTPVLMVRATEEVQ